MKKLRHILISVISIILIVFFIGKVFSLATSSTTNTTDFPEKITVKRLEIGYYEHTSSYPWIPTYYSYQISANFELHTEDYVYCVQQGASTYERVSGLSFGQQRHKVEEIVKIKGNVAQWYQLVER